MVEIKRNRKPGLYVLRAFLVSSLFAIGLAPVAIAQNTTYVYSGKPFTGCPSGGCSPGATKITGSFTVAEPLPKGLGGQGTSFPLQVRIFPVSFSFTDGINIFTNTNAFQCSICPFFEVTTDLEGQINTWSVTIQTATEEIDTFATFDFGHFQGNDDSIPSTGCGCASFNSDAGSWMIEKVSLIDPIPTFDNASLVDDHGVVNLPVLLAASKQTVEGVAADGTTQVVVRIVDSGGMEGDQVTFTLFNDQTPRTASNSGSEDGYFISLLDGTVSGNRITVTAVKPAGSLEPMAFTVYHAPLDFARSGNQRDPDARDRAVTIQADILGRNGTSQTQMGEVSIVRPPVALIHGIWSDRTTWDFFAPLVLPKEQYDPRFQVFRVDYRRHHADHVDTIVKSDDESPFDQLASYLSEFKARLNVAAVQFDFVVHSMGGLVTRDMALDPRFREVRNYNQGIVHKLLTMGTPHNGSPLVNNLNQSNAACKAALGLAGDNVAGAVQDLSVGSSFLLKVNGPQLSTTLRLRAHAIVGIADLNQEVSSEVRVAKVVLCPSILPPGSSNGFHDLLGDSDLIVPHDSQSFGFLPATTFETISPVIHTVDHILFTVGPDELNRIIVSGSVSLNPALTNDPTIDPNRVINGLNTPISDTSYWADIKP